MCYFIFVFFCIPTLGYEGSQWGQVDLIFLSVHIHVSVSVQSTASPFGDQSVRPVILRSTCGCRMRVPQDNLYSINLSPHSGMKYPSGVQSSLYFRPYLCLSVPMSVCPCRFLTIIRTACNFLQRMRTQATGSNPLSGIIICPSVRPSFLPSVRSSAGLFQFLYLY